MAIRALILLLLAVSTGAAQEKKFAIAFGGGVGIPTGYFRLKEIYPAGFRQVVVSPGYAIPGWNADLLLAYKPARFFAAFTSLMRYQDNPMDANAVAKNHGADFHARVGHWQTRSFLLGLASKGIFPRSSEGLKFYLKLLMGPAYCQLPAVSVDGVNQNYQYYQSAATTYAMAYLLGGGMRLRIGEHVGILVNADYFLTKAEFTDVRVERTNGSGSENLKIKQNITVFSLGIGLGFCF